MQPVNIKRFCTIAKKMRLDARIRMHRSRASGAPNLSRYGRFCEFHFVWLIMSWLLAVERGTNPIALLRLGSQTLAVHIIYFLLFLAMFGVRSGSRTLTERFCSICCVCICFRELRGRSGCLNLAIFVNSKKRNCLF